MLNNVDTAVLDFHWGEEIGFHKSLENSGRKVQKVREWYKKKHLENRG
jgi:hypothetical protein